MIILETVCNELKVDCRSRQKKKDQYSW